MEKKCTKCQTIQPIENFYWRKSRNNYSPKCKPCWGEESKNYNKQNKEARAEYYNKWRENNDSWKQYQREYKRKSTPQQRIIFNLRNRVYKLMLKEYKSQKTLDLIGCSRKEFMLHLEKQFDKNMTWENYGTYWEVDHKIPLSKGGTIRWDNSRPLPISDNIKKYKKCKTNSSIEYLGCSIKEYIVYLENMFLQEMTWENHGTVWEIDHIKPISKFDFSIEENIYEAFNYKNTQPLFKTTEIAKSFGYIDQIGNRNKLNKYE